MSSVHEQLHLIISKLVQHYKVDKCALSIVTPDGLRLLVSHGVPSECTDTLHRTFARQCMQRKLPTIIYDAAADPRFRGNGLVERPDAAARFFAGVPLACRRDLYVGALCIFDSTPRPGCTLMDCEFLELEAMNVLDVLSEAVAAVLPDTPEDEEDALDFEDSCHKAVVASQPCLMEFRHILSRQISSGGA